jgi:hypothetical protein
MKENKKQKHVITLNGKPFEVPPGATLGIFALGSVGIRAWREAKRKHNESQKNGEKEA